MTTPQPAALPELSRGQIIDLISPLSNNSADHDIEFAHRVIAALQSQPAAAGVSDAEIDWIASQNTRSVDTPTRFVTDVRATVRAILARRPQAVPMTDEQRQQAFNNSWATSADFFAGIVAAEAHHFGITAQGAQGGEG